MTRAGLAFLPLFACVGAAPPTDDALRAWRPTLEIAATDPIFGLEQTITVSIDGNTRPRRSARGVRFRRPWCRPV
jgi:hypothetical protein